VEELLQTAGGGSEYLLGGEVGGVGKDLKEKTNTGKLQRGSPLNRSVLHVNYSGCPMQGNRVERGGGGILSKEATPTVAGVVGQIGKFGGGGKWVSMDHCPQQNAGLNCHEWVWISEAIVREKQRNS